MMVRDDDDYLIIKSTATKVMIDLLLFNVKWRMTGGCSDGDDSDYDKYARIS